MDIDYEKAQTTPYEFNVRLLKEINNDIWERNEKGTIIGLDHLKFTQAATILLLRITNELKVNPYE